MDSLPLVGQAEGVPLGGSHQPSVDQIIDCSVNVVKVVRQHARDAVEESEPSS